MTKREERPDLRDVEPIAPAPAGAEPDAADEIDRYAMAAAAGPTGVPAVGVAAESVEAEPASLDPDRDDGDRNAAGGGWEGANEVIENDFETEQLRRE
jgi:hypothetical protein